MARMSVFRFSALALLLLSACCWADNVVGSSQGPSSPSVNVRSDNDPILIGGDIAIGSEDERNADPCTSRGCMWGKYTDGKVYVPYYITNHFF